jgi:trk system potassium uptake protein TrkA
MVKKQVCVIGMGRFGSTVANELYQSGHDVLAIDNDEAKIQEQLGRVTYAVRADATNESVLQELDIPDYDVAIVALGSENIQASVGMTVLLKSLGVPMIIARAANDLHGETLERIGADRVLFPEAENARRVARLEFTRELLDYMPILADYGISKIRPPEGMLNHTLEEAELSGSGDRHGISVLAIRRGRTSLLHPARDEVMQSGDVLILAATSEQISRLPEIAKRLEESDAARGASRRGAAGARARQMLRDLG